MLRKIRWGAPCFAMLLFFGCSLATRAQDTGTQQSNPQAQSGMHHGSRLEWLSKQLNLTDDQKAKVKPILEDEAKQMKAAREDTSLSQDQKRDKMKQIHETANSQINDILTPDQQKKFAQLKEQQKTHREGNKPDESKQPQ
jgi:periplasmic protein CpxP/Spy